MRTFRLVKGGTFWKFGIILFHDLSVGKEVVLISGGLTSYFVKSIRVIAFIQKYAVWK